MAPLETKWQSNFASGYEIASILATKNSVYTAKNGAIFRLDDNGSVTASNNLPGTGYSEVRLAASGDGSLLIAGTNGYVVGLNAQSLQAQWTTDLPDSGYDVTNVSCVNGRVYTGCNSHLYGLNIFNGNVEAHNPPSKHSHNEVRFGHAASSKTVVVGTDGWAVGLRDENLEVVWSKELPGSGYAVCSVVGTENVAYVGTAGIVYQLEASTGKLLNRNDLSGVGLQEVRLALNKGANMLYAATNGYGVGLRPDNVGTVYSTSLPCMRER